MGEEKTERKELELMKKARFVVWLTIGYLILDIIILYFTMQSSQAMKAAWIEDLLYLIPSISFLIASKIATKPASKNFRFGYDRAYTIGFLLSSFALFTIGVYLLIESLLKLVNHEVVTIGTTSIFGETIWFGWLMILAIGYGIVPVFLIGKEKLKISKKVNIQILYVDAKGQKADWLTSVATIFGIVGIGFGLWWADAVAAIVIALDILSDGVKSLKAATSEAMDRTPLNAFLQKEEPLVKKIEELVQNEDWVKDSLVRFRRSGNKVTGEILVMSQTEENLQENIHELKEKITNFNWQITEVVVSPVKEFPEIFDKKI